MGTTTTQHATLLGFSPPLVNAGEIDLRLHFENRVPLDVTASIGMLASLRDALSALLGPPDGTEKIAPRLGRPGHKLAPKRAAIYRRVIAAVHAGSEWESAAAAEGVKAVNVKSWWHNQKKHSAIRKPGEPLTKPSGAIL